MLCCGKPCHKPLPNCPHPCRVTCHPGACPGSWRCEEEVTVRCACKTLRAKWPCYKVAEGLVGAGRPAAYDASTTLRLLPCGAECAAAQPAAPARDTAKQQPQPQSRGSKAAAAPSETRTATETSAGAQQQASSAPKAKLTRAEREAEAARREEERLKREAKERRLQQLRSAVVWAFILLLGLALGVGLPRLLAE